MEDMKGYIIVVSIVFAIFLILAMILLFNKDDEQ